MSDSRLKPSLLIGHIQSSEGLAVRTKQVRCTLCPGERESITSVLIYSGEQCKGTVWRIVNKRPQAYAFVLSLCQHSPWGGGGPRFPSAVQIFRFAKGGLWGGSLHTLWQCPCAAARSVREPDPVESCAL